MSPVYKATQADERPYRADRVGSLLRPGCPSEARLRWKAGSLAPSSKEASA